MDYAVTILPAAGRQLAALPPEARLRLAEAIAALATNPRPAPPLGRKLQGAPNAYRLRLPPYRVVYRLDSKARTATVVWVGLRRDAYRQ